MTHTVEKLFIEIAARAKFDTPYETFKNGVDCHGYRFDLTNVFGDFEIVTVPMPFSTEDAARYALYNRLLEMHNLPQVA